MQAWRYCTVILLTYFGTNCNGILVLVWLFKIQKFEPHRSSAELKFERSDRSLHMRDVSYIFWYH